MYEEVKGSMMVEKENESNSVRESFPCVWERNGGFKRVGSEIYLYINPKVVMY